jgi:dihydrofolate synthase/folylpolyglutamate synthase
MNYEETIERIHSFQRFGSKLGLERMTRLMDCLGNPQDKIKTIHVGGTNGKGSVCRYLASALKENGYRIGLYTSPYLEEFTERIEYDGEEISKEELIECASAVFECVDLLLEQGCESPTEFELVTAIGFVYFSRKPIDILILEVGLGGRGDSTNIIKNPLVSVITSISYDHMNVLGNTLSEIAKEKAGIIKENSIIVANVEDEEAEKEIIKVAKEKRSEYFDVSEIGISDISKSLEGYSFVVNLDKPTRVKIGMIGMHQVSNALCALKVVEVLCNEGIINIEKENLLAGMRKAFVKGRMEILQKTPLVMLDGAHNIAGVKALVQVVWDHLQGKKILLVTGMLAEKEIEPMLDELCKVPWDIVATAPDNPNKAEAATLCGIVKSKGRECVATEDWEKGLKHILKEMNNYDAIIITGSLYLIGKIRGQLKNEGKKSIAGL